MGQQPSTAAGKTKKPKKLQTDSQLSINDPDDNDSNSGNNLDSVKSKKQSPTNKKTFFNKLLIPSNSPSPSPSISQSQSPKNGEKSRHSPQPVQQQQQFIDDENNPFMAPLDHIREEERPLVALAESTHFDLQTLRKLQLIFDDISESSIDDGIIDASELTSAMGLDNDCLLARALFRIFDLTKTKKINFRTWIKTLSALSTKASMEEKIKFSFSLYDLNEDGSIDINELRILLAAAVRESVLTLNEEQVQAVCDHTLRHVDRDKNGIVDYNEYREVVSKSRRFVESFTLDIPRLLQSFRVNGKQLTQEEANKKRHLWEKRKEKQKKDLENNESGRENTNKQNNNNNNSDFTLNKRGSISTSEVEATTGQSGTLGV